MPFTFSHPAIVLPAAIIPKKYYSWTGLIIGSMAPDFEYFIRMNALSEYSHRLSGILWFDLPLGLILAFIFHEVVRDSLIFNLPKIFRERLTNYSNFNWTRYFKNKWFIVILSMLVGSLSHILWDAFTHEGGYFVKHMSLLQSRFHLLGFNFEVYFFLQYLCSLIGGIAIIAYILRLPVEKKASPSFDPNYWVFVGLISMIGFMFKAFVGFDSRTFHYAIVVVIASGLLAITITSWLFKPRLDVKRIRK